MKARRLPALVLGLAAACGALPVWAASDSCYDKAQTQADLNACSAENLKRSDAELNQLYRQILVRLSGDQPAQAALTKAQRAWMDFRDQECRFVTLRTADGSIHPMMLNECRARIARNRVSDLRDDLACATSATDDQMAAECAVPVNPKEGATQ